MKTRSILAITLLAASITTSVFAKSPDWDLIQFGYAKVDIEGLDEFSPAGFAIGGSKLLGENVFATGSYSLVTDDFQGVDIDLTLVSLGLGYRYGVTAFTDVYGAVSYEYIELEGSLGRDSTSIDDNGYGLTIGLRSRLSDNVELDASISYLDIDDEGETGFGIGANYYFTPNFAAGVSYAIADDVDSLGISARYAF